MQAIIYANELPPRVTASTFCKSAFVAKFEALEAGTKKEVDWYAAEPKPFIDTLYELTFYVDEPLMDGVTLKVPFVSPVEKEYEWSINTAFDGTAVWTVSPFTSFALSAVEHRLAGFPFLSVTYIRPSMSQ